MSGAPSALSAKPSPRPSHARAARLETFQREQLIVDYLNRVAIQVSRLSEALLNAFSAMSPSNLKAVDQVVKIVRELDRYGGAFAAEWARANAPGRDAPADEDVAFAKAWLGSGEVPLEGGDDRPENPAQGLENIESAPGDLPLAPLQPGEAHPLLREAGKVSPKATDGVWSAATNFVRFARSSQPTAGGAAPLAAPHPALSGHLPQQAGEGVRAERWEMCATLGVNGEQGRPENPAQGLENIEFSARGIGRRGGLEPTSRRRALRRSSA